MTSISKKTPTTKRHKSKRTIATNTKTRFKFGGAGLLKRTVMLAMLVVLFGGIGLYTQLQSRAATGSVKAFDTAWTINDPAWFKNMYANGFRLYILHTTTWDTCDPWPLAEAHVQMALDSGLKVAAYTRDPRCWENGIKAVGQYKPQLQFFVLDVEDDPGVQVTRAMVDGVKAMGVRPVIYSEAGMWANVMGSNTSFSDVPLWDTNVRDMGTIDLATWQPDVLQPTPIKFGGWNTFLTMRKGIQQSFETTIDGINVDLNSFDQSFLFEPPAYTNLNLAAGKPVTSGAPFTQNLQYATDGAIGTDKYANLSEGPQWLKIDLGASHNLERVKLWHYFGDSRTYRDVIVQVSDTADFSSGVTTVFNNDADNSAGQGVGSQAEYAESPNGKEILFSPVSARYLRLWSNGSAANPYSHYIEVMAYAAATATPPPPTGDITAPIVTMVKPADNATIGRSTAIKATATDNVKVTRMEVWIDGVRKSNNTNSSSISYSWNSGNATRGAHTITVKAFDAKANIGTRTITVYR